MNGSFFKRMLKLKAVFAAILVLSVGFACFAAEEKVAVEENNAAVALEKQSQSRRYKNVEENNTAVDLEKQLLLAMSSTDYQVTPGDIYQLDFIAGGSHVSYKMIVDSNCSIKVANLGIINGENKTFVQLKKEVEAIINKNYPLNACQFTILKTSIFSITVKGAVNVARKEEAWALTRLSEIYERNATEFSSKRNVTVVSKNYGTKNYDLFLTERYGDFSQDPYVRPGDIVILNEKEFEVTVAGAVERPGSYELKKGETLKDLIDVYGNGFLNRADKERIEITHFLDIEESASEKEYVSEEAFNNNKLLMDKDVVTVYSFMDLHGIFFIEGAIAVSQNDTQLVSSNRRAVTFEKNEDYAYVLRAYKDLFSESADLKNAYILRGKDVIKMDLEEVLYNVKYMANLVPEKNDVLMVPFSQPFVTVAGAVNNPGRYPYIPDRDWNYYIGLAGGFDKTKNSANMVTIRDKNNKHMSKSSKITPETTITAQTNAFTYYFGIYAPIVTTVLGVVSTGLTLYVATK